STPRPNADRHSSIRRHPSVVKDPAHVERPLVLPFGGSARIRTRARELWRLGFFRYTTLSLRHRPSYQLSILNTPLLSDLSQNLPGVRPTKTGLLGDRPRRPDDSMSSGPLGRATPLILHSVIPATAGLSP